jgi:hypothetical protein
MPTRSADSRLTFAVEGYMTQPSSREVSPSHLLPGSPVSLRVVSRSTRSGLMASGSRKPSSYDGSLALTATKSPIPGAPTADAPPCSGGSRLITSSGARLLMGWSTLEVGDALSAAFGKSLSQQLLERLASQATTPEMSELPASEPVDRSTTDAQHDHRPALLGAVHRRRRGRHRRSRDRVALGGTSAGGDSGDRGTGWLRQLRRTFDRWVRGYGMRRQPERLALTPRTALVSIEASPNPEEGLT